MNTGEPMIKPLPSEEQFRRMADELIEPDSHRADDQVKALITIVLTFANPEDPETWHLATQTARHAFTRSRAFEQAYRAFAGYPERLGIPADRTIVTAAQEM